MPRLIHISSSTGKWGWISSFLLRLVISLGSQWLNLQCLFFGSAFKQSYQVAFVLECEQVYLPVPFHPRVVLLISPSFQIKVSSLIENLLPSLQAPVLYLCVTSHSLRLAAKDLVAADGACIVRGHQFTTDLGHVASKHLVQ